MPRAGLRLGAKEGWGRKSVDLFLTFFFGGGVDHLLTFLIDIGWDLWALTFRGTDGFSNLTHTKLNVLKRGKTLCGWFKRNIVSDLSRFLG